MRWCNFLQPVLVLEFFQLVPAGIDVTCQMHSFMLRQGIAVASLFPGIALMFSHRPSCGSDDAFDYR